jgi:phage gpG-like protein
MSTDPLKQFKQELRSYLKTVPRLMGRAVLEEAAANFRRQGYEDDNGAVVPWAERKHPDKIKGRKRKNGTRGPSRTNPRQRAILVKTGRLKRSVRIVATTDTSVTVGSSEEYAQAQQEGNGRLPARPFITVSPSLKGKLMKRISADIIKLLK